MEKVFDVLNDGTWHDVNEVSTAKGLRKLSMTKLMALLDFLAEYDFIELNEVWKGEPLRSVVEVKLQPSTQKFLREIKLVERTEKGGKV